MSYSTPDLTPFSSPVAASTPLTPLESLQREFSHSQTISERRLHAFAIQKTNWVEKFKQQELCHSQMISDTAFHYNKTLQTWEAKNQELQMKVQESQKKEKLQVTSNEETSRTLMECREVLESTCTENTRLTKENGELALRNHRQEHDMKELKRRLERYDSQ